jgi:hypothetical protein
MTDFGNSERDDWTSQQPILMEWSLGGGYPRSRTDTRKTGLDDHHKCYVSVPSREASNLVITQTHPFAYFKILLNMPPLSERFDHFGKGGA